MKRFISQLGNLFDTDSVPDSQAAQSATPFAPLPPSRHRSTLLAQPTLDGNEPFDKEPLDRDNAASDFDFGNRIEDIGPGKTIVRTSYLRNAENDEESLTLADSAGVNDSQPEFDPYNSGQFDRARNWARIRRT